jgi:tetratricopeptide (TPR) repeat protein
MKKVFVAVCVAFICSISANSQTDDIRAATGLPIPIGAQVIYGKVTLRGLRSNERPPLSFVTLLIGGAQVDRAQTNDRGYYYFLRSPSDGMSLVVEVGGREVGRIILSAGVGSSVRQDFEVNWDAGAGTSAPGVVSAKDLYQRSPAANKQFDLAIAASKAKDHKGAIDVFKKIVEADPKDFVAWTELGTLYFEDNKLDDAEAAYKSAITQKPDFVPALMNLGKLYLGQKKYDDAANAFFGAVKADQTSADAFQYLGETYLQMKQGSKAVMALNEALRLQPDEKAEIHLRLAVLYIGAGAKDRAADEYRLYLQKRPNTPDKDKLEKFIKENSKQ